MDRTCVQCHAPLDPSRRKFCTTACGRTAHHRYHQVQCPDCGEERRVRADKPAGRCRPCQARVNGQRGGMPPRNSPSCPVAFVDCQRCGRTFTAHGPGMRNRSICDADDCRPVRTFVEGPCAWCGERFTVIDQTAARYCSKQCLKDAGHHRRGRFTLPRSVRLAIYERDGWTCQLCGDPVDPALGPEHQWAATLDHIVCRSWTLVPDDSPANLRLAHRWCNSVRGDEQHYTADDLAA